MLHVSTLCYPTPWVLLASVFSQPAGMHLSLVGEARWWFTYFLQHYWSHLGVIQILCKFYFIYLVYMAVCLRWAKSNEQAAWWLWVWLALIALYLVKYIWFVPQKAVEVDWSAETSEDICHWCASSTSPRCDSNESGSLTSYASRSHRLGMRHDIFQTDYGPRQKVKKL